ncbi:MAG: Bpu10I family restriction endonuclease [Chloroflexota bacterium]
MGNVNGEPQHVLEAMVRLVNEYKMYVDLDLIFDSNEDFLYRQKGQLKLDNSIIEEFVPWLVRPPSVPELGTEIDVGPNKCFSAVYFSSSITRPGRGGGLKIRSKNQDFAISRRVHVRSSYTPDFAEYAQDQTFVAHVAAEIKTNLDKTMFQEACATAHDVKSAAPGSKYYLICEWLDMTPLSTAPTDIDEVLILRKAKRLNANLRQHFSTSEGRRRHRQIFEEYLRNNPLRSAVFQRFLDHINALLREQDPGEEDVLVQGFF